MSESTQHKKLLFTGPVGAGKTTAIQSMSDIPIVSTNESATDMTKIRKSNTTVSMDYGYIKIGGKEKIHLYGTPGQERFDFMWDILKNGAVGLVLLIDNSRNNPKQDLMFYTKSFKDFIDADKLVIGVTRMDQKKSPSIQNYRNWLEELSIDAPVFSVDAREKADISALIQALLFSMNPRVTA